MQIQLLSVILTTLPLKSILYLCWESHHDVVDNMLDYDIVGLVSLFNGISAFEGYLMPKPIS